MYAKISMSLIRFDASVGAQNPTTMMRTILLKGIIQNAINLVSAHVGKIIPPLYKGLRKCANNPALEDYVIQNHYLCMYTKTSTSLLKICVYVQIIQRWKAE